MFLRYIKDFLFPIYCLCCQKEGQYLCTVCFKKISPNIYPLTLPNNSALNQAVALFDYKNEIISQLIQRLKYNWELEIADVFNKIFTVTINRFGVYLFQNYCDCIVIPVPLYPLRLRQRGFNQSAILADIFAKKLNIAVWENGLKKIKNTACQVDLDAKERQQNLKQVFLWNNKIKAPKNVLLFDDVYTTGATLEECAQVLKQNGVQKVYGLVLARG